MKSENFGTGPARSATHRFRGGLGLLLFVAILRTACPGADAGAARSSENPAAHRVVVPRSGPNAPQRTRYRKPDPSEIQSNRLQALQWGEQTRATITPAFHLIETRNFLIFSAWDASQDRGLADVCERMFEKLRQQFNLQPDESVWAGKCPVYVFWKASDFRRFAAEIDRSPTTTSKAGRADGYHATRGRFSYIVINGLQDLGVTPGAAISRFYEVLVHEGTHGFMSRFISNRSLPLWVEEGVADYMAAALLPNSQANRKYLDATRVALESPRIVSSLLTKKDLSNLEYGIAQSLVRYLMSVNGPAFVRFIERMKSGESQDQALAETFRVTPSQLARNWALFCQRFLASHPT